MCLHVHCVTVDINECEGHGRVCGRVWHTRRCAFLCTLSVNTRTHYFAVGVLSLCNGHCVTHLSVEKCCVYQDYVLTGPMRVCVHTECTHVQGICCVTSSVIAQCMAQWQAHMGAHRAAVITTCPRGRKHLYVCALWCSHTCHWLCVSV